MRFATVRIRTQLEEGPLSDLYGEVEPFHHALVSGEPLRAVSVFGNAAGPHWHYLAFGLRERFGFELSFRLVATSVESAADAPTWPILLLKLLAAHTIGTGRALGTGQYICFEEALDPAYAVRCFAILEDPQLTGSHLQAVGLHESELQIISEDGYERFLGALRERAPLLVTEPRRPALEAGNYPPSMD